ncbi:MAG: KH domain-containing protein [Akkermansiaceae bacterium]|nr:KH domain-containing protein [Akkermansiaceae bacterium]
MKDLVEHIARSLVEHPEALRITEVDGEKTVIFELRCHPSDLGKIIGKSGKTVGAVRTLLSAIAARQGRRAMLEIVE